MQQGGQSHPSPPLVPKVRGELHTRCMHVCISLDSHWQSIACLPVADPGSMDGFMQSEAMPT